MSITHTPIRDLAATHPASISVFERFQIDLCAMGGKSLAEACRELCLSLDQVEEKLLALLPEDPSAADFSSLSLIQLIQRIVRVHHRRVRQDLPALGRMANRLSEKNAWPPAQAGTVQRLLNELHLSLLHHIDAEEHLVFPGIAQLAEDSSMAFGAAHPLHQSLHRAQREHSSAIQALNELRTQTDGFQPSASACTTQRALYKGLQDFEQDLHTHLHLEDDILFPRALALHANLAERS